MIKQGLQEVLTDVGQQPTAALPPLNNLPQWSRVNTLDKSRYPKPFLRDRLQPLPNPAEPRRDSIDSDDRELDFADTMNSTQRIHHLEKSINFLQQQHQDVLFSLHQEIDNLKRDNKDLLFRIVMIQKSPQTSAKRKDRHETTEKSFRESSSRASRKTMMKHSPASMREFHHDQHSEHQSQVSDEKTEELKIIFLEEEIVELKKTIRDEKNRNHRLSQLLEQAEKQKQQKEIVEEPTGKTHSAKARPGSQRSQVLAVGAAAEPLPYNCTTDPLLVRLSSASQRPPTLRECEVIIQHLQTVNDKQSHELNQLKSDLRDVLYSHKWTPDAYLLARAYIAEDDAREHAEQNKMARVPYRGASRKLPDIAHIPKDALSLPPLKQTMGNKAIERRKRAQILQKSRIRREMTGMSHPAGEVED